MDLQEKVLELNQSDFLRHYLFVVEKYNEMRIENSQRTSAMLYYVKNAEKVKTNIKERRIKKQQSEDKRRMGA